MMKIGQKYTALFPLLLMSTAQANMFGAEMQAEVVHEIYQGCMDGNKLGKVAEIAEISKPQWCGCLIGQVQKQFDDVQFQQRLNSDNITLKQAQQEIGKVGENAADYCVDKLFK